MTTRDYTANVISATKVVPDGNFKDSKASGVWDINEALDLIKGGNWPNVANINPAAFVDALFSTHLWDGNGSSRSITNNIDLSGKGGLVWIKGRDTGGQGASQRSSLYDTERGAPKRLISAHDFAEADEATGLTAFNSNGFSIGADAETNQSNYDYVSWAFRKQPKFFDLVKYTGNGSTQDISHSLGSTPGMVIIKKTSSTSEWFVWHTGVGNSHYLILNTTAAKASYSNWLNPTSTTISLQNDSTNSNGATYIAYFFAHNNNDGGFGSASDQDIIKCGSYTGNGNSTGPEINLGFEPQFIMLKKVNSNTNANWYVFDSMRGMLVSGDDPYLYWNTNAAEVAGNVLKITAEGFQLKTTANGFNGNSDTYIYMAIRRGGMQTPTAASDVFSIHNRDGEPNSSALSLGNSHVIDMVMSANRYDDSTNYRYITDRIRGKDLLLNVNNGDDEFTGSNYIQFDDSTNNIIPAGGYGNNSGGTSLDSVFWMWKRAKGYFDIVTYETTSASNIGVVHSLGVSPEMIWTKRRDDGSNSQWLVTIPALSGTLYLNETSALSNNIRVTNIDSTSITMATGGTFSHAEENAEYVSYLFATAPGVSKIGTFSHTNGSTTDVDCGFTGDTPSFVLLKRTNDSGSWIVMDSERGIVAGNDPWIKLDTLDAEATGNDVIDPLSGGFQVASGYLATGTWLFYAIASIA